VVPLIMVPDSYPRISKQTPLLSVPLGKPPAFNMKIILGGVK
jgi:hypothetical protein